MDVRSHGEKSHRLVAQGTTQTNTDQQRAGGDATATQESTTEIVLPTALSGQMENQKHNI